MYPSSDPLKAVFQTAEHNLERNSIFSKVEAKAHSSDFFPQSAMCTLYDASSQQMLMFVKRTQSSQIGIVLLMKTLSPIRHVHIV